MHPPGACINGTGLFSSAAVVPQSKSTKLCSSVAVVPRKVNLPSCVVARRPLCHKVNLPSCVAWRLKNVVLTARVMIFAAFEYIVFARGLRLLPLYQCDFKAIWQFFSCTLGTLSIDNEMGRPEVKFSRANLMGMRQVVKTSSSLRRRRNSGRFAVVAKT